MVLNFPVGKLLCSLIFGEIVRDTQSHKMMVFIRLRDHAVSEVNHIMNMIRFTNV